MIQDCKIIDNAFDLWSRAREKLEQVKSPLYEVTGCSSRLVAHAESHFACQLIVFSITM